MSFNQEQMRNFSAIYRFVYANPGVHRNVLRKNLINKGKIASKEKFFQTLDSMIAFDMVKMDGENLHLNPDVVDVAVLHKSKDNCYVVLPKSNQKLNISYNVVAGYESGDLIDVTFIQNDEKTEIVLLGKSQKTKEIENARNKKREVAPSKLLDENCLLGRVVKISHDNLVFIPNKKSLPIRQIPILNSKSEFASFQDKICVMRLENRDAPLLGGEIVEVKGEAGNPVHEYDAIAEAYGAIMDWSDAEEEIKHIPKSVDVSKLDLISEEEAVFGQKGKIVDLRHLQFTTVDPATCKDMDDAIYSTIDKNGNMVVYTAVANVPKYVNLDSVIGEKYITSGFTIYAPNKAYSILPSELSTGICSLNPFEDRLAFVVKSVLNPETGEVLESSIYDAIINSKQKYSYELAQEIVDSADFFEVQQEIFAKLEHNIELSLEEQTILNYIAGDVIKTGFERRNMIRFCSNKEREIVFDEALEDVVDIKPIPHLQYHEVIEAFMITANEATAKYLKERKLNNIYRVHEKPSAKKIVRANEFFNILGVEFDGDLSAKGMQTLLGLIKNSSNEEEINAFLIKMQSRAKYSSILHTEQELEKLPKEMQEELISHYALQSKQYSHTTSPIRRIVDYFTISAILADMHGEKPISPKIINGVVEIANERQLQVDQAEKDFQDISSVIYCEKHIGEKFSGKISKIRYASVEEEFEDDIVVIVKNESKGISVEIPLSQVIGRSGMDYTISEQGCAVYDAMGNVVLHICKPVDFVIDKASRQTMTVVGKTNKTLVKQAESRRNNYGHHRPNSNYSNSKVQKRENRSKRIQDKKSHHNHAGHEKSSE